MVNADGDFVIAKPDKAAWELYQEKLKASAAAAAEAQAAEESKALRARGLECPIDKRMFLEPTKTPCCQRTYCNDCISNALIESDFVCPGCSTEGVLLDNLTSDEEAVSKIKAYETEKADAKKEKEKQSASQDTDSKGQSPTHQARAGIVATQSKKRPAEDVATPDSDSINSCNTAKKSKGEEDAGDRSDPDSISKETPVSNSSSTSFPQMVPFGTFGPIPPFSDGGFGNEAMGFLNPMTIPNNFPTAMSSGWNPMNMVNMPNMPFNPIQAGMYGDQTNGFPNMFNGDPSMGMLPTTQMAATMRNPAFPGSGMSNFANQQRTAFSGPYTREEDSPYFRQPVNPQRHQARQRRVRPSDYREL